MKTVRRIIWPTIALVVFMTIAFFSRDLLGRFGVEAVTQTRKIFWYAVQIGIWLSATFFLDRIIKVFLWDGFVARIAGAPLPRLVKDLFTVFLFMVAITGIVGIVFGQSVTGIWATSGAVGIVVGLALQRMILDVFSGLAINIERP